VATAKVLKRRNKREKRKEREKETGHVEGN
jgi:hypothetical protein